MRHPSTLDELRALIAATPHIRAAGTGHSFSPITDTTGDLVSLASLPADVDIDSAGATARVAAGITFGELAPRLHAAGWALPNMASLPHISIGGAVATGTHGSGTRNLSASVSALDIAGPDGEVSRVDRPDPHFAGSVVSLGALGIFTHITIDLLPTFELSQWVLLDVARERLAEAFQSAYSVSLFTDWFGPARLWVKSLSRRVPDWATPATTPQHPIASLPADACTDQLGVPGPWHERLPHFRLSHIPSSGNELQSEYFVPLATGPSALDSLDPLRDRIAEVLQITEIRLVLGDDLWMSPAYGRDSMAIHFTWKPDRPRVTALLPLIEERLAPFAPRPHWGKLFHAAPVYPRQAEFAALVASRDPHGKFRNEFVRPWTAPRL